MLGIPEEILNEIHKRITDLAIENRALLSRITRIERTLTLIMKLDGDGCEVDGQSETRN